MPVVKDHSLHSAKSVISNKATCIECNGCGTSSNPLLVPYCKCKDAHLLHRGCLNKMQLHALPRCAACPDCLEPWTYYVFWVYTQQYGMLQDRGPLQIIKVMNENEGRIHKFKGKEVDFATSHRQGSSTVAAGSAKRARSDSEYIMTPVATAENASLLLTDYQHAENDVKQFLEDVLQDIEKLDPDSNKIRVPPPDVLLKLEGRDGDNNRQRPARAYDTYKKKLKKVVNSLPVIRHILVERAEETEQLKAFNEYLNLFEKAVSYPILSKSPSSLQVEMASFAQSTETGLNSADEELPSSLQPSNNIDGPQRTTSPRLSSGAKSLTSDWRAIDARVRVKLATSNSSSAKTALDLYHKDRKDCYDQIGDRAQEARRFLA